MFAILNARDGALRCAEFPREGRLGEPAFLAQVLDERADVFEPCGHADTNILMTQIYEHRVSIIASLGCHVNEDVPAALLASNYTNGYE